MTAGNKRKSSVPVFLHRPGSRRLASGRNRQNVTTLSPCSLLPSRSSGTPMCGAGREEPFDELSAWIFSPTLTRHSHLMSAQRGNPVRR